MEPSTRTSSTRSEATSSNARLRRSGRPSGHRSIGSSANVVTGELVPLPEVPVRPTVLHGSRKRHSDPASFRHLCETRRRRASNLQHAIQRKDCDANFSRSARIRVRPQRVPDHPFVSIDIGLNQRTPVVARRFLPGDSASLGNDVNQHRNGTPVETGPTP
jgi:hypothetical protein